MRGWIKDIAMKLAEQFKHKKQEQKVEAGGIGIQAGGDISDLTIDTKKIRSLEELGLRVQGGARADTLRQIVREVAEQDKVTRAGIEAVRSDNDRNKLSRPNGRWDD